jgi:hypothetical protein
VAAYDLAEVPRLVECARRVAANGGQFGDLRRAFNAPDPTTLRLSWGVREADADGKPTVRVAHLDKMRWPGLAVWHERGRYELMAVTRSSAPYGISGGPVLEPTGFSFATQAALREHLFSVSALTPEPA